jgi:tetratricopeptide (TPR) repeat protein
VLESASVSYGKATPYFPVLDLLRRYGHVDDGDDLRTIRAKITGQVLTLDTALQDTVAALLALLDALPDDSPFLRLDPPQRRQYTLAALKRVLLRESQVQLAERLGDPQRLGRIVSSLCYSFSLMGEHDRAIAAGQQALALATSSGAVDVQINAQNNLSVAYYAAGDFRQALDVAQRMVAVLMEELPSERFGLSSFPGVTGRGYVASCLPELGGFAEGTGRGEEAVRLAEAVAQPNSMISVLSRVGLCYRRQGVLQKAIPLLEQCLALSQSADIPIQFPPVASLLSAAYALAGRTAEPPPLLDQMLERLATGRRMLRHALVLTELSEACLLVGRVDEARALAARLLELSHTHIGPGYQVHAYRLLGEVARHREPPDIDQGATHYRQALTLAEEAGMRPLQAHCHRGLGTLFATAGQAELACAELATALAMYQAMAMTFWLPEAEAALSQVEGG